MLWTNTDVVNTDVIYTDVKPSESPRTEQTRGWSRGRGLSLSCSSTRSVSTNYLTSDLISLDCVTEITVTVMRVVTAPSLCVCVCLPGLWPHLLPRIKVSGDFHTSAHGRVSVWHLWPAAAAELVEPPEALEAGGRTWRPELSWAASLCVPAGERLPPQCHQRHLHPLVSDAQRERRGAGRHPRLLPGPSAGPAHARLLPLR